MKFTKIIVIITVILLLLLLFGSIVNAAARDLFNGLVIPMGKQKIQDALFEQINNKDPKAAGQLKSFMPFLMSPTSATIGLAKQGLTDTCKGEKKCTNDFDVLFKTGDCMQNLEGCATNKIMDQLVKNKILTQEEIAMFGQIKQAYGAAQLLMAPDGNGDLGKMYTDKTGGVLAVGNNGESFKLKKAKVNPAESRPGIVAFNCESSPCEVGSSLSAANSGNGAPRGTGAVVKGSEDGPDNDISQQSKGFTNDISVVGGDENTEIIINRDDGSFSCEGICTELNVKGGVFSGFDKYVFSKVVVQGNQKIPGGGMFFVERMELTAGEDASFNIAENPINLKKGDKLVYTAGKNGATVSVSNADSKKTDGLQKTDTQKSCFEHSNGKACGAFEMEIDNGKATNIILDSSSYYEYSSDADNIMRLSNDEKFQISFGRTCTQKNCVSVIGDYKFDVKGDVQIKNRKNDGYSISVEDDRITGWDFGNEIPNGLSLKSGEEYLNCDNNGGCLWGKGEENYGMLSDKGGFISRGAYYYRIPIPKKGDEKTRDALNEISEQLEVAQRLSVDIRTIREAGLISGGLLTQAPVGSIINDADIAVKEAQIGSILENSIRPFFDGAGASSLDFLRRDIYYNSKIYYNFDINGIDSSDPFAKQAYTMFTDLSARASLREDGLQIPSTDFLNLQKSAIGCEDLKSIEMCTKAFNLALDISRDMSLNGQKPNPSQQLIVNTNYFKSLRTLYGIARDEENEIGIFDTFNDPARLRDFGRGILNSVEGKYYPDRAAQLNSLYWSTNGAAELITKARGIMGSKGWNIEDVYGFNFDNPTNARYITLKDPDYYSKKEAHDILVTYSNLFDKPEFVDNIYLQKAREILRTKGWNADDVKGWSNKNSPGYLKSSDPNYESKKTVLELLSKNDIKTAELIKKNLLPSGSLYADLVKTGALSPLNLATVSPIGMLTKLRGVVGLGKSAKAAEELSVAARLAKESIGVARMLKPGERAAIAKMNLNDASGIALSIDGEAGKIEQIALKTIGKEDVVKYSELADAASASRKISEGIKSAIPALDGTDGVLILNIKRSELDSLLKGETGISPKTNSLGFTVRINKGSNVYETREIADVINGENEIALVLRPSVVSRNTDIVITSQTKPKDLMKLLKKYSTDRSLSEDSVRSLMVEASRLEKGQAMILRSKGTGSDILTHGGEKFMSAVIIPRSKGAKEAARILQPRGVAVFDEVGRLVLP